MQIQGYTLFMGNRTKDKKTSVWNNNTQQTQSDKTEHKKTIFVGNGQTNQTDTLAQKKKEAQDKAMKVIRDAFAKEIEIDNGIEESRGKISDSQAKIAEAQEQIKALEEQKEEIRKSGCSEDEYKEVCADYAKQEAEFYSQIKDAKSTMRDENASIRQVKIDRIQNQDMQNAMQEADDIIDAASKYDPNCYEGNAGAHGREAQKRSRKSKRKGRRGRKGKETQGTCGREKCSKPAGY